MTAHNDHKPDLGQPNGIATLDGTGKVPASQIPAAGGGHPVVIKAVDPTVTDDSSAGYAAGDHWINTTAVPPRVFQAVSVAVGAAVWKRLSNLKHNATTTDPLTSNDNTQGYEVGSTWTNTTDKDRFACISAATGVAVWLETTNVPGAGKQTPKEHFLDGSLLVYGAVGAHSLGASIIQYTRIWLTAGTTISLIRTFVDSGQAAGRHIRMGLYDQNAPTSTTGVPNNKVAETAEVGTTLLYMDVPLGSSYVVTVTGYYWIAHVTDSVSVKFALSSIVYRQDFVPKRAESTTGTALPGAAGTVTNPQSSIVYASAVEP